MFWKKFEIDFRQFYLLPSIFYDWYNNSLSFDWLGIHFELSW